MGMIQEKDVASEKFKRDFLIGYFWGRVAGKPNLGNNNNDKEE